MVRVPAGARGESGGAADGPTFVAPAVRDAPIERFDDHGLGQEPDNLAAIDAPGSIRTLRWGAHVELILTDNRSFRSEPVTDRPEAEPFEPKGSPISSPRT